MPLGVSREAFPLVTASFHLSDFQFSYTELLRSFIYIVPYLFNTERVAPKNGSKMSIIKFQKSHNDFVALDLTIYHYYIIGRRECQYAGNVHNSFTRRNAVTAIPLLTKSGKCGKI